MIVTALRWIPENLAKEQSSLVRESNKPLLEPILTEICVALWRIGNMSAVNSSVVLFGYGRKCASTMMTHQWRYWPFLWGESTVHRWIPLTKGSDEKLWYFLWSAPEQTVANNQDAGDLRHHRAHYDIIVMTNILSATKVRYSPDRLVNQNTVHLGMIQNLHIALPYAVCLLK